MSAYPIVLPDLDVARAFDQLVQPWCQRIVANVREAQTLAALRDALLPRLMSGEIRVRDAERQLVEAV